MMTATQGETIKAAREARRMTQAVLAQAAGVSAKTVGRAERDEPLAAESVMAICAVLGIEAASLARPAKPEAIEVRDIEPAPTKPRLPIPTGVEAAMVGLMVLIFVGATGLRYHQAKGIDDAFKDAAYMRALSGAGYQAVQDDGFRSVIASQIVVWCTRVLFGGQACPEPPIRDGLDKSSVRVVGWRG